LIQLLRKYLIGSNILGRRDLVNSFEIEYLKDRLQDKLIHQSKSLSLHKELGFEDSLRDSSGELSSYDNHPADLGSETYELAKAICIRQASGQANP
jgi:hypothetical protein